MDLKAIERDYEGRIIGVDEVNYSPSLCGDTIVCACILRNNPPRGLLKDSKKTTHKHRLKAFEWLQKNSVYVIEVAGTNHIEHYGVYSARNQAMFRAAWGLLQMLTFGPLDLTRYMVIMDGNSIRQVREMWANAYLGNVADLRFVVEGDSKVPVVSAASMIARVYADALFEGWEVNWPGYGMNKDHGSVSASHKKKLFESGPTPVHRCAGYAVEWWEDIMNPKKGKKK